MEECVKILTPSLVHSGVTDPLFVIVKILTPSLVHSRVMGPLFVISLLYLVSSSIIPLTIHYQPLYIPFQSIHSLVLSINIITLGSSSINYDFILSKQQMFHLETWHSGLLYCSFLFYHFIYVSLLSRYIILSFVLFTLVLKVSLVTPILLLSLSLGFPLFYWRFPCYTSEIGTTEGSGGTAHKLRLRSYWLHLQSFWSFHPTFSML